MSRATQIDPEDCGCTECGSGEYVPLNLARTEDVLRLLFGSVSNATGWPLNEVLDHARPQVRESIHWIALHDFIARHNPNADIFRT